jgi:hypothetical protein
LTLAPNFGGEEGLSWRKAIQTPQGRRIAALWRVLFAGRPIILGGESIPCLFDGGEFDRPAFAGLPSHGGAAWLATPSAWRELDRRRAEPWGADPGVVRIVHDKAFARRAAPPIAPDAFPAAPFSIVLDPSDFDDPASLETRIRSVLETWPDWARASWTLKPRFGSSGRGRVPGFGLAVDSPQFRGSLTRFAQRGGAVLEPFLDRTEDLSAQFFVRPGGEIQLLGTLRQRLTVSGSYLGHEGVLEGGAVRSGGRFEHALVDTSTPLVQAAARAGFWGPCGVDAFAHRFDGSEFFRPCVELNARFTMGTVVLGLIRRVCAVCDSARALADEGAKWRFDMIASGPRASTSLEQDGLAIPFGESVLSLARRA